MATLTIADLDNGKRDLQTVDRVANSRAATATTRFGQQTTTLYESIRRINATGDEILSNLGFRVPVPYASGLNVTDSRITVTGPDGKVYAPLSAPFTTGAWNPSQWYVLQNDLNDRKLLIFDTLLAAEAAATVLPSGQELLVRETDTLFTVASAALADPRPQDTAIKYSASTTGESMSDALQNRAVITDFASVSEAFSSPTRVAVRQDTTVLIPGDAPTLQAAVDKFIPESGAIIDLVIQSSHQLAGGVSVSDGNYGPFRIKSEDPIVQVSDSFAPANESVIYATRGTAPTLMCRIDARNKAKYGYHLKDRGFGAVDELCGIDNCSTGLIEGAGLHLNAACVVAAYRSIFNGSYRNGWIAHESLCMSDRANFDGATGDAGLYSARGSTVGISYGSVSNCQGNGIRVRRAKCIAMAGTFKNNGLGGSGYNAQVVEVSELVLSQGGPLDDQGSDLTNGAQGALYVDNSRVNVMNSNLTGPGNAIQAVNGAIVASHNSILSGAVRGVYATSGAVVIATGAKINGTSSEAILSQGAEVHFDSSGSQITNCNRGLCADYGGRIIANNAQVSGSTNESVRARQGSQINVQSATLSGGTHGIVATQNSDVDATSATIQNPTLDAISADGTSRIHGQSATVTGSGRYGAVATYGGQIVLRNGSVKNSGTNDLRVQKGGQIHANACSTTAGAGAPALSNTNVAAFNTWTGNGVIFD